MLQPEKGMRSALDRRSEAGSLRSLRIADSKIADFSSNDYLGVNARRRLASSQDAVSSDKHGSGATGSRLLSGHSRAADSLERKIAAFHGAASALLFNSGYDANVGLLSSVPSSEDVVIYDELIHASVHDGMRLSRARASLVPFPHNSVSGLRAAIIALKKDMKQERRLDKVDCRGWKPYSIFVAIESVYSMDGDVAPLQEMLDLANEESSSYVSVVLVVDEAHSGGLHGPRGEGLAFALNLQNHAHLFARVFTYGKAFGSHGASVVGSSLLCKYLVNYARPFIYSTALPPHSLITLSSAYDYMSTGHAAEARRDLIERLRTFRSAAGASLPEGTLLEAGDRTPIQSILIPGNERCVAVASEVRKRGFDVYPIRSPTVPRGSERIRIVLHAHNAPDEVLGLVQALVDALRRKRPVFEPKSRL